MKSALPKPKKTIPWKDREHPFTPPNIMKLEFILSIEVKHTIVRPCSKRFKPRKQRNGKVTIIKFKEEEKGGRE